MAFIKLTSLRDRNSLVRRTIWDVGWHHWKTSARLTVINFLMKYCNEKWYNCRQILVPLTQKTAKPRDLFLIRKRSWLHQSRMKSTTMMSIAFVFLFVVEYSAAKYILVEITDKVDDGLGTIAGLERSFKGISYRFLDECFFYLFFKWDDVQKIQINHRDT